MKLSRSLVILGAVVALGRPGAAQATDTTWIPASDDATLYEHPTGGLANGAGMHMFTGRTEESQLSIRRALVRFDIHDYVKADAKVHEAKLLLYVSLPPDSSQQVSIHRVLQSWSEDTVDAPGTEEQGAPIGNRGVTWLRRDPVCVGCFWSTPGGDFDPLPLAASTLTDSVGIYEWQSPALAEAAETWVTTCASSGGVILLTDEAQGGNLIRLNTRNHSDSAVRPLLQVVWSGGCLIDVPGKTVAAIGLRDWMIVETEDALLICPRNRAQDVKDLVELIKRRKLQHLL